MAFAMMCTVAFAQEKRVTLTQAGTLSSQIAAEEKLNITNLSITGPINGTDILFIREMAGAGKEENLSTTGKLTHLNLQAANLVNGGDSYYFVQKNGRKKGYNIAEDNLVDHYMFYGCDKLVNVTLPANTLKINNYAFFGCKSLASITIPASVDYLGDYAFAKCEALKKVEIPASVNNMANAVFNSCTALETATFYKDCEITNIRRKTFEGCTALKTVKLPSTVESLGLRAFANCSSLSSFTLPASFIEKASDTFEDTPIKNYYVEDGIEGFAAVDGVLYNEDLSTLLLYPVARTDQSFTVPENVMAIGEQAFFGATNLKSVKLPSRLTNILEQAFAKSAITEIEFPAELTSIDSEAFSNCRSLTKATFKGGISGIGAKAFLATQLKEVTFNEMNAVPELGRQTFFTLNRDLKFYVPDAKIEAFKQAIVSANASNEGRYEVVGLSATGISNVQNTDAAAEVSRFNAAGQRVSAPVRGLNIVKMANGKTVKTIAR